jgi:hypothetical protein
MLTNARRFIEYFCGRLSWLFMEVPSSKVGFGCRESLSWLLGKCSKNAGNNSQCSQHRHRPLRDSFSREPFPASMFERRGALLRVARKSLAAHALLIKATTKSSNARTFASMRP